MNKLDILTQLNYLKEVLGETLQDLSEVTEAAIKEKYLTDTLILSIKKKPENIEASIEAMSILLKSLDTYIEDNKKIEKTYGEIYKDVSN